jgi:hypothetical protein
MGVVRHADAGAFQSTSQTNNHILNSPVHRLGLLLTDCSLGTSGNWYSHKVSFGYINLKDRNFVWGILNGFRKTSNFILQNVSGVLHHPVSLCYFPLS